MLILGIVFILYKLLDNVNIENIFSSLKTEDCLNLKTILEEYQVFDNKIYANLENAFFNLKNQEYLNLDQLLEENMNTNVILQIQEFLKSKPIIENNLIIGIIFIIIGMIILYLSNIIFKKIYVYCFIIPTIFLLIVFNNLLINHFIIDYFLLILIITSFIDILIEAIRWIIFNQQFNRVPNDHDQASKPIKIIKGSKGSGKTHYLLFDSDDSKGKYHTIINPQDIDIVHQKNAQILEQEKKDQKVQEQQQDSKDKKNTLYLSLMGINSDILGAFLMQKLLDNDLYEGKKIPEWIANNPKITFNHIVNFSIGISEEDIKKLIIFRKIETIIFEDLERVPENQQEEFALQLMRIIKTLEETCHIYFVISDNNQDVCELIQEKLSAEIKDVNFLINEKLEILKKNKIDNVDFKNEEIMYSIKNRREFDNYIKKYQQKEYKNQEINFSDFLKIELLNTHENVKEIIKEIIIKNPYKIETFSKIAGESLTAREAINIGKIISDNSILNRKARNFNDDQIKNLNEWTIFLEKQNLSLKVSEIETAANNTLILNNQFKDIIKNIDEYSKLKKYIDCNQSQINNLNEWLNILEVKNLSIKESEIDKVKNNVLIYDKNFKILIENIQNKKFFKVILEYQNIEQNNFKLLVNKINLDDLDENIIMRIIKNPLIKNNQYKKIINHTNNNSLLNIASTTEGLDKKVQVQLNSGDRSLQDIKWKGFNISTNFEKYIIIKNNQNYFSIDDLLSIINYLGDDYEITDYNDN